MVKKKNCENEYFEKGEILVWLCGLKGVRLKKKVRHRDYAC